MSKKREYLSIKEKADIPKNIVVLVLLIAVIVSALGTWMVLDKISGIETPAQNKIIPATTQGQIALNIEYDSKENQTKGEE